jgi:hypothetical protein
MGAARTLSASQTDATSQTDRPDAKSARTIAWTWAASLVASGVVVSDRRRSVVVKERVLSEVAQSVAQWKE